MVDWELEMEKVRKDHRAREERLKYVLVFAWDDTHILVSRELQQLAKEISSERKAEVNHAQPRRDGYTLLPQVP